MSIDNEVEVEEVELEEVEDEEVEEVEEVVEKQQESLEDKEARQERQLAQTRKKMGKDAPKKEQSDEFGLAEKGYLKQSGFKASEFDFVEAELKKSGDGDIEALLENPYFNARLESHRELATTSDATPKDSNSKGTAVDSVDYWKGKEDADIQKNGPKGMMLEVVNERLKEQKQGGHFYDS